MASTDKTPNLQLNQWVLSDPVLMEDFNADNRKIEEAILESAEKMEIMRNDSLLERIAEAKITQPGVKNVTIDLTGVDLTKYQQLRLCRVTTGASANFYLRLNNKSVIYYYKSSASGWVSSGTATNISYGYADFFMANVGSQLFWQSLENLFYCYGANITPLMLTSINLMMNEAANQDFTLGDSFTLLGVKK